MKNMITDITNEPRFSILSNPALEAALKTFNEEMDAGQPDITPVFDLMIQQMQEDVEVICPVEFPDGLPSYNEHQSFW